MEIDELVLARIQKQIKDVNVDGAVNDLKILSNCFVDIVGLLHKHKIQLPQKWYEYYETMGIKFRLNIQSIIKLYEIEKDEGDGLIYHDLSSIYLLNRSLLEIYLTFFYSYVLPGTDEEGLMNYYIFKISGFTQRQGYSIDEVHNKSIGRDKLLESEKLKIDELKTELQKLNTFVGLEEKDKKRLLTGKFAKRFGFIELIQMSKLKNILFVDMWKLYSNYAHCELIGLLQTNSYADEPESINGALYSTLTNTLIVVSFMISDFIKVFRNTGAEQAEIEEINDEFLTLLEFWKGMGTD